MSNILAVFGATGLQGGSLIKYVLSDPELSPQYKVRAITRNVNSEAAKKLKEKDVEVVYGDVSDAASIRDALVGANAVFAMTTPVFGPSAVEDECNHAKTIADAAVSTGVTNLIFSTLPGPLQISEGKYTAVTPFDAKSNAEKYIRSLPIKSAFYSPAFFMENFHMQPFLGPRKQPDGTWVLARPTSPDTKWAYINAGEDTGKFVGAILAEPDKYEGKTFCAASGLYTMNEIAAALSKSSGQKVVYKQISSEEFGKTLPFMAELFVEGMKFLEEFGGYWGPKSGEYTTWATKHARGQLSSLEEYLTKKPLHLA